MLKATWCSLLLAIVALAVGGATAQAQTVDDGTKLLGTWVDEKGGYYYSKLEIISEVKMITYMKGSADPYSEARYSVDRKWTDDGGNTFYACVTRWSWVPFDESKVYNKTFFLFKVDATGDSMQANHSTKAMPTDFSSGVISTYKRQQPE